MPLQKYHSHKTVEAGRVTAFNLDDDGSQYCVRLEGESEDRILTGKVGERLTRMAAEINTLLNGGYLIYYPDGYISWSPAKPFEEGYLPDLPPKAEPMNFGRALEELKMGHRVARLGWNGKGMFLYLVDGSTFEVNRKPLSDIHPPGTEIEYRGHIDMQTADGSCVPWVASQSDLLAHDWVEVR